VRQLAAAGDFPISNPPYAPVTRTANFTSYTSQPFGTEAQRGLQHLVVALAERGWQGAPQQLDGARDYGAVSDAHRACAGLRTLRVPARRAVNSDASRRGPVSEYLVTNVVSR
jgi:DNA adenine methylase